MVKVKHLRKKEIGSTNGQKKTPTKENKVKYNDTKPRYAIWVVASICLVFLFFALSVLFSRATVTVNPKIKEIVLNENLSASKDSNTNNLPFDLVVISGEESKTVQATGQKEISQKAKGIVLIYNAFSSSAQILGAGTKLEGSNGKIYTTQAKVIVPGTAKDGKPGSVEVNISGAETGEQYNSAPLDFKIASFNGTKKYSGFYARSKGEIVGGLNGKFPVISDTQKNDVMSELKTTLQAKLAKKVNDQIPSGFILFKDATLLNIEDENAEFASKDKTLPVKIKGTLYGLLFEEKKLTKKIAEGTVENYDGSEVYLSNIRNLTFSMLNKENLSFADLKDISFNLSGATKVVWKFDASKLTADLLGKPKKHFNQILSQYPNIDSADLVLSPIWVRSLPDKTKDIKVIVNYPK